MKELIHLFEQFDRLELPVIWNLASGLSDNELNGILQPYPFTLPLDVRSYFQWRNGTRSDSSYQVYLFDGGGVFSLQESVNELHHLMAQTGKWLPNQPDSSLSDQEKVEIDPNYVLYEPRGWNYHWLPLLGLGVTRFFVVCNRSERETSPIYYTNLHDFGFVTMKYDNMTTFMQTILAAYQSGVYRWVEDYPECTSEQQFARLVDQFNPRRRQYLLHAARAENLNDLVKNLVHSEQEIAKRAFVALNELLEPGSVAPLLSLLNHNHHQVRQQVLQIMADVATSDELPYIEVLQYDPDKIVRVVAKAAVEKIQTRHNIVVQK